MSLEHAIQIAESTGWFDACDSNRVLTLARVSLLSGGILLDELGLDEAVADRSGASRGLGRYQVVRSLGEGGMGSVFLARDHQLDRNVAVKLMHTTLRSERQRRRFQREAAVMARLKHPVCVEVFDVGLTERGEPFLVMEFVAGRDLQAVLQEDGPQPSRDVARWGREVAEALQACHEAGVLHRDVKPGNILLTQQGQIRLSDFGVAHDAEAHTQLTRGAVGTLLYMAPELLDGAPPTPRSEVYALGATLYELLSGTPPFSGPSQLELLRQVASSEAPSLRSAGVEQDLDQVVLKCLQKSAADRYQSCQELGLDLGRFLGGAPVTARPLGFMASAARWSWRQRRFLAVALVSGAISLGALLAGRAATFSAQRRQARKHLELASELLERPKLESIEAAEALIREGDGFSDQGDRERAADLLRRSIGLKLLLQAHEAKRDQRRSALALVSATGPVSFDSVSAGVRARDLAAYRQGERGTGGLYRAHLSAYTEAVRAVASASGYLGRSDWAPVALDIELSAAEALAELWPEEAGHHRRRALRLYPGTDLPEALRPPTLSLNSAGTWFLYEPSVGPVSLRGPTSVLLTPGVWRGFVWRPKSVVFGFCFVLQRGQRYSLEVPAILGSDLPAVLRSEVTGLLGGETRVGPFRRRAKERIAPFLMQRTEVTREMVYSYLTQHSGLTSEGGEAYLSPSAQAELRKPQFPSTEPRAPCAGLEFVDMLRFIYWLNSEMALAGSPLRLRLPRAIEFFHALRGGSPWRFSWGNELRDEQALVQRVAVGSDLMDVSPLGVFDLVGSVSEVCAEPLPPASAFQPTISGSHDGAPLSQQLEGVWDTYKTTGNYRGYSTLIGFRLVVDLGAKREEQGRSASLPRSLELQHLARARLRSGDFMPAMDLATAALQAHNKNVAAWTIRGEARLALADNWGAWWDCEQVLELEPDNANPRLWGIYGRAAARSHRWEKAIPICTKALALNEGDSNLYFFRGWSYAELGQHAEALVDLETHLERLPDSANRLQALDLIKASKEALVQQEHSKKQ